MKHTVTYNHQSQFIEMFGSDNYPQVSLDSIAIEWLKGQPFKKENITHKGSKKCIHYGELFTKYGPIIEKVYSSTNCEIKRASKVGDILFPASDVTPNGLARCSMLPFNNVLLGGDIIILRPKEGLNYSYLSSAINQQKEQLFQRVTGGLIKHLSAKGLKTVKIPWPPIEFQKEFAEIVRQADKSKYYVQNKLNYICLILTKQIPLRRCS